MDITGLIVILGGLVLMYKQKKAPYQGDTVLWKINDSYIISNKGDYINEN